MGLYTMGSYCELYISDYPIYSSKSYVYPPVMTMFQELDKNISSKVLHNISNPEYDEIEEVIEYRISVIQARQRLDIVGFSMNRVINEFNSVKMSALENYREWDTDGYDLYSNSIEILEKVTLEDYLNAFKKILSNKVPPYDYVEKHPEASSLIKYIFEDHEEFYWGFPCNDIRCFLRAILEIAPDDSYAVQDISDLVYGGYYDHQDHVCKLALQDMVGDYTISSKIIVLTEGSTDTEFLVKSLKLLYPHLFDYYTFMDFGFKPPGGVGPLVNAVKSFAGAGIQNRVIALFDNDTAAFSAAEGLKNITMPDNIIVTHYPDIALAQSYPALGPNGENQQNINNLACSIELYLGKDVLTKHNKFIPIQWKGYDTKIGRYQGEILDKVNIQKRFRKKIDKALDEPNKIDHSNWDELKNLLHHIFSVFHT